MLRLDQTDMIAAVADRLRAIADENRIRLMLALKDGEQSVNGLVAAVGIAQASVSKHLAVLKGAGLVECRREGTQMFYSIVDDRVFDMCAIVCDGVIRHIKSQQQIINDLTAGVKARKGRAA